MDLLMGSSFRKIYHPTPCLFLIPPNTPFLPSVPLFPVTTNLAQLPEKNALKASFLSLHSRKMEKRSLVFGFLSQKPSNRLTGPA
jgi:hypothetical protein